MILPLDVVTRKKLILVKQIYQRALIQSKAKHSPVDRIFAVVGFDLANETILKAVVAALNPTKQPANDFQSIVNQAESELNTRGTSIPDKVKIQHVRSLRNDAQHKAKYPNEAEVNDCRTYTRDFLMQTISDVWGESFESISLIDIIQDVEAKTLLLQAEKKFIEGEYLETVLDLVQVFSRMISGLANSIIKKIPDIQGIIVSKNFGRTEANKDLLTVLLQTRTLIITQTIGINHQEYLRYKHLTRNIVMFVPHEGTRIVGDLDSNDHPTKEDAEYVLNFVTNSVVLIESLDKDIKSAYDPFS
jgi:hypothetical protein